jgi:hypothetical protein
MGLLCLLLRIQNQPLTPKAEQRLRILENRVLRGMLGPKRDEVTGDWSKLYSEKLNDLYPST